MVCKVTPCHLYYLLSMGEYMYYYITILCFVVSLNLNKYFVLNVILVSPHKELLSKRKHGIERRYLRVMYDSCRVLEGDVQRGLLNLLRDICKFPYYYVKHIRCRLQYYFITDNFMACYY